MQTGTRRWVAAIAAAAALAATAPMEIATAAPGDPAVEWSAITTGAVGGNVLDVTAGPAGTAVVNGTNGGWAATLGGTALVQADDASSWLAKLDASGAVQWRWAIGGDWDEDITDVVVEPSGAVWATIAARGTNVRLVDGKAGTVDTELSLRDDWVEYESVVVRFNPDGTLDWVAKGGSVGNDQPMGIALDGSGGAYVTGIIGGEDPYHADFGDVTIEGVAGVDGFLVHYDGDGDATWGISIGGEGREELVEIDVDPDGHPILVGWVYGMADLFGPVTPESSPGTMVVRVDPATQDLEWVRRYASRPPQAQTGLGVWAYDVKADPDGSYWMAGYFDVNIVLGSLSADATLSGQVKDAFVAHLDAAGRPLTLGVLGGDGAERAEEIELDASGRPVVFGSSARTLLLPGGTSAVGANGGEAYAAWLTRDLALGKAVVLGGDANDTGNGGALLSTGKAMLGGQFDARSITLGATTHTVPDSDNAQQGMVVRLSPATLPRFGDVPFNHPFYADIEWLAAGGAAGGYADGTFRPGSPITRQAMAAFLWRQAGEPAVPPGAPSFPDVPVSHPFHDAIGWLAGTGLATGYDDGLFRPGNKISRQAMAAFLWRRAGEPSVAGSLPSFPDVGPSHRFATPIGWMASEDITGGYPDGTFRPVSPVTRQAMAAFLRRYDTCCTP